MVKAKPYAAKAGVKARWQRLKTLPDGPDLVDQDAFGICGMASAVHILLRHAQGKAEALFQATYADVIHDYRGKVFTTAQHRCIAIDYTYLVRRWGLMEKAAHAGPLTDLEQEYLGAKPQRDFVCKPGDEANYHFVDYCVSRALGYVLKKVNESRYRGEKLEFAPAFAKSHDHRQVTRAESLPLRTNNLAFIMKDILGATDVHIASKDGPAPVVPLAPTVANVTQSKFRTFDELQAEFRRLNTPKSFALGAVYGHLINGGLRTGGHVAKAFTPPPNLGYNHWVVFKSLDKRAAGAVPAIACTQPHVHLEIWTWANNYDAYLHEPDCLSYVQDVIFGHF
jgi:hypothetical protein